ncbi:MAG TPA: hypothetical protein VHO28_15750 [Ignavibacteriales bacterium]|nr:hypothetical protein [Ignavibacteriales bacterium]
MYYLSLNSVNQLGMTVYSRNLESGADRQITHDSVSVLNYMPSSDDNYIAIGTNYHETYLYNLQTGVLTLLSASSSGSDFGFTSALDKVFWRSMQGSIISANIDGTNERVLIPDVYLFFGAAKVKK